MKHNLLVERIFSVHTRSGPEKFSLPGVLAALARDEILTFDQIRMHQRQAWFCFLVQLASLTDISPEVTSEEEWKDALMELADGEESMWCLVVGDLSKPAFMQPPVPEGDWSALGTEIRTADSLDLLITSKNHDLKSERFRAPLIEHWIYALITLQTTEQYSGSGNYGTVRMNGGSSSRPFVTGFSKKSIGSSWFEQSGLLTQIEKSTADNFQYALDGFSLLWEIPWDGKEAIALTKCRPFFIEIVRRIRFGSDLKCFRGSSDNRRIYVDKNRKGVIGDPWVPVIQDKDGLKALTLSESGFDFKRIHELLWNDTSIQPQSLAIENLKMVSFSSLGRGNCKTFGFHERQIRIPPKHRSLFSSTSGQEKLAIRSKIQIETAAMIRKILLSSVLMLLTSGEGGKVDFIKYGHWLEGYESQLDAQFFEHLWGGLEDDAETIKKSWIGICDKIARSQIDTALGAVPFSGPRKYRAISEAKSVYCRLFRKKFNEILKEEKVS